MKRAVLVYLSLFAVIINGGSINIENDIKNYESPKTELISKGRNLILDAYIAGDLEKVKEAFVYLESKVTDANYASFTFFEKVYLCSLFKDYPSALSEISKVDSLAQVNDDKRVYPILPKDDNFSRKMYEQSFIYLPTIYKQIQQSDLKEVDKKMLLLELNYLFTYPGKTREEKDKQQSEMNEKCDSFLLAYPHSSYEHFVRNYLRYKIVPSNYAFGYDFGLGYNSMMGGMSSYLQGNVDLALGLEYYYRKYLFDFRMRMGAPTLSKDISFGNNATLPSGQVSNLMMVNLDVGHLLKETKRLAIYPFVGGGLMSLSPSDSAASRNPATKSKEFDVPFLSLGVNVDLKFMASNIYSGMGYEYNTSGYGFARFRLSYMLPLSSEPVFQGGFINFSVGIGLLARRSKRDI